MFKRPTRFRLRVPEVEAKFLNMCWDGEGVRVSVPGPDGSKYRVWITIPVQWVEEITNGSEA